MRLTYILWGLMISSICFAQESEWITTEAEITEITVHQGRKTRETAMVKFLLADGTKQIGTTELFRIPFVGSMKSVGDVIDISYDPANPVLVETTFGKLLRDYGMYVLILLGIIFSARTYLKARKQTYPA